MRFAGRISGWNEDKGYGFVVPHDGGDRAFVHIKAFQRGSRRPAEGDLISYAINKDGRGRTNAIDVRFAGQRIQQRKAPHKPMPRMALGLIFLAACAAGTMLDIIPAAITVLYVALSVLSYVMYTTDKRAAGTHRQRTPEHALHLADLLGGWPGALVAQQLSRHKTAKAYFQAVFWFTVCVNVIGVLWLVRNGYAVLLADLLPGT